MKIGDHQIGENQRCFIIAEAGVNHNGDADLARELIKQAKWSGADSIKFQTFKAERVVTSSAPKAKYQLGTTDPAESQLRMLQKLELAFEAYQELIDMCNQEGIVFFSTPYNEEDVDFLDELDIPAYKLASIHIAEPAFLQYVANKGRPMIVSTGMATLAEVDTAVRAIRETGNDQFVLLQCTTNYPSRLEDANLRTIPTMRQAFHVPVGYSDHTQTDTACLVAIGLGACVIEKHFTIDKTLPGPDQSTSYDAEEFRHLVQGIREAEIVLGSALKEPSNVEVVNAVGMRRSLVAKREIAKGEIISREMLTFKRPATGLSPAFMDRIVGMRARQAIAEDKLLDWSDLER